MQKILRSLLLALLVVGFMMPCLSKAEAAKLVVLPVVTNEDDENAAVSRRVWNEECMSIFKFPEFDIFLLYKDSLLSTATQEFITFMNKKNI